MNIRINLILLDCAWATFWRPIVWVYLHPIFTSAVAQQAMQALVLLQQRWASACLSVRLSQCLPVCHTLVSYQYEQRYVFFQQRRARRLWFLQISGSSQNSKGIIPSEDIKWYWDMYELAIIDHRICVCIRLFLGACVYLGILITVCL